MMLGEMTFQNASKFAIFLEYKIPHSLQENNKFELEMKKQEQIMLVLTCSMTIFEPFTFDISSCKNF